MLRGVICCLFLVVNLCLSSENVKLRYEYKHSFKGPGLAQSDNTIPFWTTVGDAVPGDEQIRVVPSLRGKSGGVWSNHPFPYDRWEVELDFRVRGRGKVGADGLVLWLVEEPNKAGSVFGYKDQWKGMGLFFDSFDNDNQNNNPYISLLVNDGTISYDHGTDGITQKLGGCLRDFRNRPYPVKAKITFVDNTLTVMIDSGNTAVEDYEFCLEAKGIMIPKNYYFGITAATGGLADDHDVLKFLAWSVPENVTDAEEQEQDEEKLKYQQEYEKNLEEFKKEQEEFREKHPDQVRQEMESQAEELFEGASSRELQAVFDVQSQIKTQVNALLVNVMSMVQKQQDIMDRIDQVGAGASPIDTSQLARTHDINSLHETQKMVLELVELLRGDSRGMRDSLATISNQMNRIGTASGGQGTAGTAYETHKGMINVQEQLDAVRNTLNGIQTKQNNPPKLSCPEPPTTSCVPVTVFIVVAIVQVVAIILYHSFKTSREDAAKKFF